MEAGAFATPATTDAFKTLPAFCRVAATLTPSSDSDIKIEVWLPAENWNGKFQAVGNGGWGGAIRYPEMARAVAHGYATAGTDTGHATQGASFAMGHPEKLVDFGYRAVHEMTVEAKALICGVLFATGAALVLERLFDRRPPGLDGGAAFSGGLRRHRGMRAGKLPVASAAVDVVGSEGSA